jgi:hypothetical protein
LQVSEDYESTLNELLSQFQEGAGYAADEILTANNYCNLAEENEIEKEMTVEELVAAVTKEAEGGSSGESSGGDDNPPPPPPTLQQALAAADTLLQYVGNNPGSCSAEQQLQVEGVIASLGAMRLVRARFARQPSIHSFFQRVEGEGQGGEEGEQEQEGQQEQ